MASERPRLTGAWVYVLSADRALSAEQQSRFTLRPLSAGERDFWRDNMSRRVNNGAGVEEKITNTSQMARALCLGHIEAVENFPAGAAARRWPSDQAAREEFLDRMHDAHVIEIGTEIFTRSFLGEEEREQLGEASPPTATPNLAGA